MENNITSEMYFLSKFCRICIKSSEELKDIESFDHDSIKFSEKLKVCTKMVINKESISTLICTSCIRKLRISYEFDNMCKKSNAILQNYLSELLSSKENVASELHVKSELFIKLAKLPEHNRKPRHYVTKEKRCSLLKELLTKINDDKKHFHTKSTIKVKTEDSLKEKPHQYTPSRKHGGLKPLLDFTKTYNYGYLDEKFVTNIDFEISNLDKLSEFVSNYFCIDLTKYHDNISYILEQSDEWSDESDMEEMFNPITRTIKFEEVIVEPDINIKKEIFADETGGNNLDMNYEVTPSDQCFYENECKLNIKVEPEESVVSDSESGYVSHNRLTDTIPINKYSSNKSSSDILSPSSSLKSNSELYPVLCQSLDKNSQSTLNLLQEFTDKRFKRHRNTISKHSAKCRTKNLPFISPQLKKQFLYQDFKCTVCNRSFKSQGYLSAHCSKMKHKPY